MFVLAYHPHQILSLKTTAFYNIATCSLLLDRLLEVFTASIIRVIALTMGAVSTFGMPADFYETIRRNVLEGHLHTRCSKNLKSDRYCGFSPWLNFHTFDCENELHNVKVELELKTETVYMKEGILTHFDFAHYQSNFCVIKMLMKQVPNYSVHTFINKRKVYLFLRYTRFGS
jgi:hypothetical protein